MSSTEVHSKKSSPGIIAKLMGLDGLPPQQKRPLEDARMKNPSRKKNEIQNTFSNGSSRRSTKGQQEFKDVFEVSEALLTKSFSFERIQKSNLTDEKMMLIRQQFGDSKQLSTSKKLQNSDIFDDRLEALYCRRDKSHSLQKLDFLSARHNSHDFCCTPETRNRHARRHGDWSSTYFNSYHGGRRSFQMEGAESLSNMAAKIVILKPNLGKEQHAASTVSSTRSSPLSGSGFGAQEFQRTTNRSTETLWKKSFPAASGLRHKHRGSEEIAKEVNTIQRSYTNFPSSRIYYYEESGSSSDESANETGMEILRSRNSLQSNNKRRLSSSSHKESFVSREAKKRMSERWKLTNISQDKDVIRRSSTLAEMLAIPAKESVPANRDFSRIRENRFQNRLLNEDKLAGWNEPLGISSRDGTKVFSYDGSYRSTSSSPASMAKIHFSDKYGTQEEAMKLERNKATEGLPEISTNRFDECNSIVPAISVVEEKTDSVSSPDHRERPQSPAKQETHHQSPVSTLEPPFKDDFSSCSDCFHSLSVDLEGLRMQLQLLKLESEDYDGGPCLISSDRYSDDHDQLGEEDSWEFSYICEVLSDSGLDYSDPNDSKKPWLSPDFPVNPSIFEELEKKHDGYTTQPRSERKLLFDRINGGIVEIFRSLKGKTLTSQLRPKWTKEELERNLFKLLTSTQETKGEEESQWLNLGDDIEVVGEEIGKILIDELVATELVFLQWK